MYTYIYMYHICMNLQVYVYMGKSTNYYEAIQRQSSVYGCQSWSMRTDENTEKKVENENSKG